MGIDNGKNTILEENNLLENFLKLLSEKQLHDSFWLLNTCENDEERLKLLTSNNSILLYTSHNNDGEMLEWYYELVKYLKDKIKNEKINSSEVNEMTDLILRSSKSWYAF